MNSLILEYAAHGWKLVPVSPGGKHGGSILGKQWQYKASCDVDQVRAWWDEHPLAWPAVLLGPDSGIIDIEADTPEANQIADDIFDNVDTLTFTSTRSKHRLFLWNDDISKILGGKAHFTTSDEIEVRMGGHRDGKVLGALSIFPPAARREWLDRFDITRIKPIPDSFMACLSDSDASIASSRGGRNNRLTVFMGRWAAAQPTEGLELVNALQHAENFNATLDEPLASDEVGGVCRSVIDMQLRQRRHASSQPMVNAHGLTLAVVTSPIGDPSYRLMSYDWKGPVCLKSIDELNTFTAVRNAVMSQKHCPFPISMWRKGWAETVDCLLSTAEQVDPDPDVDSTAIMAACVYSAIEHGKSQFEVREGESLTTSARIEKALIDSSSSYSKVEIGRLLSSCGFRPKTVNVGGVRQRCWVVESSAMDVLARVAGF